MRVIDFRVRPRIPAALQAHQPGRISPSYRANAEQFRAVERFSPQPIPELVSEMEAAQVVHAVISASDNESMGGAKLPNEAIAEITHDYPHRFTGYAGVDPRKGMAAVAEFEHAIRDLGLRGLNTDPFLSRLFPSDAKYYPLYAKACELGVPVFSHSSNNFDPAALMEFGHPKYLDQVACDFPELIIVARHAGFPWVLDMIAVAWRHSNVYVELSGTAPKHLHPDVLRYIDGPLKGKALFGTSYPLMTFADAVDQFNALPLKESTKAAILFDNAARLLGLASHPEAENVPSRG